MHTLLRLRPYLRHEWRTVSAGLFFMVVNSLLSGFSIALTLPIIERVFLRKDAAEPTGLHVGEGLQRTWAAIRQALSGPEGWTTRGHDAQAAATQGLRAIQDQTPPLEMLGWLCVINAS